jgi:hypothetical protein
MFQEHQSQHNQLECVYIYIYISPKNQDDYTRLSIWFYEKDI